MGPFFLHIQLPVLITGLRDRRPPQEWIDESRRTVAAAMAAVSASAAR